MQIQDAKWYLRKRYYVTLMVALGWFVAMILRSNLGIAMVQMTSSAKLVTNNGTSLKVPEFNWTSIQKGLILSSFSWGYLLSPVGGILSSQFGGACVFSVGLAITALLTFLSPFLVRLSTTLFLICRIFEGVAEGISMAAVAEMYLYWMPPNERSRLFSVTHMGALFSPAIGYPLCGYIAQKYDWEAVFMVTGAITLLWFILWSVSIGKTPATDRFILLAEKTYLADQIQIPTNIESSHPWFRILKSKAVWVLLNQRFAEAWSLSLLLYCLPLFVKDIYNKNVDEIGFVSGIPHFAILFGLGLSSCFADYVRKTKFVNISKMHKILIGFGDICCGISLLVMIMWMNLTGTIICLSAFRFFSGFVITSCGILPVDIGQRYSSFVNGLGNAATSLGYILNPVIMGWMVQDHTVAEWKTYFIFLSCVNFYGCAIFILFGSGELQPWASSHENETKTKNENHTTKANL